ncbi:glyoxylate/hydroxypyruvate reductase GhrA [Cronobacter sakazakii]|uniref:glyoxylate/hydroxypyruvate reductase GhrA n=1 Tax=Cronobacter sakazakii TaxID=28141 RepID=UPI000CFC2E21|nr:glyoxylate/hydroxypyruvate reductase GhrA [Cronobacter sakazakii]ELQ6063012.1 glyoxylate/hydroxypyruvate reductase GhrA [Cronobacter sakazakii]ELY2470435.1 glyoxylate/hydroxypyruvate reductase GhrA [Cronobacter sakazakii]ELY3411236.1 glyoxylate/hydroxypyruvate reductase GhrA [Cronobacter sakazakii]ELY3802702.1 glyoxylate/hydroxypyruvate reductase GhrA [Cronobacter sakazakii]ELY4416784.1 glyoxylate/hydroxypyruvate reductase GhrA [Cronobacter sakazakii]
MDILFYHPTFDISEWAVLLQRHLPQARLRAWQPGDNAAADYALVWHPPYDMLRGRVDLKAIFALGAGVDSLLSRLNEYPDLLPSGVPLYRMEDTGMAAQMQEYAISQVLHWFRRFDDYAALQREARWEPLEAYRHTDFTIGVLGAGVLGGQVAQSLSCMGFPVRCWSRSRKALPGVESFAGPDELSAFLCGTRVLINLLPNTPETVGIINAQLLAALNDNAYVLNLARGVHLVEEDLLAALDRGKVKGAMLDVFQQEPLPHESPLWRHPRVRITPHVAAVTRPEEAVAFIAQSIARIERGDMPQGQVDVARGY